MAIAIESSATVWPLLETERLILRVPIAADYEPWAAASSDPEVMFHLGGVMPRFDAWKHFLAAVGAWHIQGFAPFSVVEKTSGEWIGRIGPLRPEGWPGTEIGWTLARGAWGRGYALEAATAATDWAFDQLGWTEIIHCIAPANAASQALATRLGSRRRGAAQMPAPLDKDPIDIWAQSREQWFDHRGRSTTP